MTKCIYDWKMQLAAAEFKITYDDEDEYKTNERKE